jgi:hypothetical protein
MPRAGRRGHQFANSSTPVGGRQSASSIRRFLGARISRQGICNGCQGAHAQPAGLGGDLTGRSVSDWSTLSVKGINGNAPEQVGT